MRARHVGVFLVALLLTVPVQAQTTAGDATAGTGARQPEQVEILGLSVQGAEQETTRDFVISRSGLRVGQKVRLPGDRAIADAVRAIYRLGLFSDVKIVQERRVGEGVFLAIKVVEEPALAAYSFEGVKKKHRKELKKAVPLLAGSPVRQSDIERSKQVIRNYFREKGFLQADVDVQRTVNEDNGLELTFDVDRGPLVQVGEIDIHGNEKVSAHKLRSRLKHTKPSAWWKFWKKDRFKRDEYEEDLTRLVDYYNEHGYYDARVVDDTFYVENREGKPEVVVDITVQEGPQYHIRDIDWDGNTIFSDDFLTERLGFQRGDVFNTAKMEENLYGPTRQSTDIASLYLNRGYMRFNVNDGVVAEGDSVDLHFDVLEGDVYSFGDVQIAGNTKTKEHVIRRELYTVPGQTFNRDAIQESLRRLSQLNFFTQESVQQPPNININEENKTVDLTYSLEEQGSDQLELSGTWGSFGLVLQLRFTFNNFSSQSLFDKSAWDPLPAGDGQRLSLSVQTNGSFFQSYSVSFTEPWLNGKPTPVGFGLSYTRFGRSNVRGISSTVGSLETGTANVFYERRLKWPDDKFSSSNGITYTYFNVDSLSSIRLPQGVSHIVTLKKSYSRNSLSHPLFPTSGSSLLFSVELAPPIGGFVQYHKWRFQTSWNVPLANKISLGFGTDYGYIGSLNGDRVDFERFVVGGSPFDTQGFNTQFGSDIVYMRGYPAGAIGPKDDGVAVGGTLLNKYTSELRWHAFTTSQLTAMPYAFLDAANTWSGFDKYDPTALFRSAGFGVRLYLPIVGMVELVYGRNFDEFVPITRQRGSHDGSKRWSFQFTLGQGFN